MGLQNATNYTSSTNNVLAVVNDDNEMFDVGTLTGDEVLAEQVVAAKDVNLSVDEVTLAQALAALKSAKVQEKGDVIKEPSVPVSAVSASTKDSAATTTTATIPTPRKGIVFQEPGTTTTTISSQQPSQANVQDKGKGKMVEPEKPMKKKELIRLDEEIASKLQAEFDEEVRLAREKAEKEQEANVALTEEWDDIQAKIEADHELAQRLQAQEQEELSDAEKATLFVQLLEKRRKHFAAKRAEEKRNKPPTQAQQRKIMCTYLKNMEGKKPKDLKNKSFDSIQKMFDRAFKRVNTFVDFRTDLVEGSSKRAGDEEEVALDAIPLAFKSPSIGGMVGIKRLLDDLEVIAAQWDQHKRWKNLLPAGSISTWDLLEKTFIRKYCPPLKTAKKLEEIRNFKQGMDETLYQAWERYNDLLFKCPQHDLNNHQKVVHPTKERSIKKDDKVGEQVKYIGFLEKTINRFMEESIKKQSQMDERIRKLWDDLDMRLRMINVATKNLQGKSEKLTQKILTSSMADNAKTIMGSEMKEQEDEAQAFRMLESLKKLKINRSLIRAVKRRPEYLMYVKDVFSSKKMIVEMDEVWLNDRCTTVLQNLPPLRENDPGSFTLPCLIFSSNIRSALADLGASINVMPFSMFKKLQIGNLQPTNMMVEMSDRSKKAPKRIIENVLVQIDKFIFLVDFVVIDMVEDHNVPLILGRPFLETTHAHIDVFNRHISLRVGQERVYFKITEPMDDPYLKYEYVYMIKCSRETHEEELELPLSSDTQSSFTKMKE
ncbi:putative ribonuclease H-like domain-containing protein [Tanacetum coccineum]|uniref:Ribonuclease H-like domain-containing protein n=1 Tax=Tanacetum coccineum TaxID=301880 RepID=A0ABQ5GRM4_9ASTR